MRESDRERQRERERERERERARERARERTRERERERKRERGGWERLTARGTEAMKENERDMTETGHIRDGSRQTVTKFSSFFLFFFETQNRFSVKMRKEKEKKMKKD